MGGVGGVRGWAVEWVGQWEGWGGILGSSRRVHAGQWDGLDCERVGEERGQ